MRAISSKASQAILRDRASAWPYLSHVVKSMRSANHLVIFRNLLISGCVSSKTTRRNQVMAFYRPQDLGPIVPRDPSAIDQRPAYGPVGNIVILLLILAVAFGLYFL